MSLIFSRQCEYALQAVLYLALQPPEKMTSIKELAQKLDDIPSPFLAKILQDLSRKGLLASLKGPTGGFALGMPAKNITLFDIVEAIDGDDFRHNCVLGFPECSGTNPCPVHGQWSGLRDSIHKMLTSKNIAQMARETKKTKFWPTGT